MFEIAIKFDWYIKWCKTITSFSEKIVINCSTREASLINEK